MSEIYSLLCYPSRLKARERREPLSVIVELYLIIGILMFRIYTFMSDFIGNKSRYGWKVALGLFDGDVSL